MKELKEFFKGLRSGELTLDQFKEIVAYVSEKHSLLQGRAVKYIDTSFDMRGEVIWRISFRGFGRETVFTHTNASEESRKIPLYDQIMKWLKDGEKKD